METANTPAANSPKQLDVVRDQTFGQALHYPHGNAICSAAYVWFLNTLFRTKPALDARVPRWANSAATGAQRRKPGQFSLPPFLNGLLTKTRQELEN